MVVVREMNSEKHDQNCQAGISVDFADSQIRFLGVLLAHSRFYCHMILPEMS